MAQLVEVYPKLGCTVDKNPAGFVWSDGSRAALKTRMDAVATRLGGIINEWHEHVDGVVEATSVQMPKMVATLSVPDSVTHDDVMAALDAEGMHEGNQQGIRDDLPPGVKPTQWQGKQETNHGKTPIDEPESVAVRRRAGP